MNENMYLNHFRNLAANGQTGEFVGCTVSEIEQVKIAQNVSFLPLVYLGFMEIMGRRAGSLFPYLEYGYPHLLDFKSSAIEINQSIPSDFTLPADAFVFRNSLDSAYYYFLTANEEPDPQIFHFGEGVNDQGWHIFHRELTTGLLQFYGIK